MRTLEIADIAEGQWGFVTTAQAGAVGGSPQTMARLAATGVLERMGHGVYRLSGVPPALHDDLRVAWLSLDPKRTAGERLRDEVPEVISHRSAARVDDLGDVAADRHEFTVARRRQSRRRDVRFHRADLTKDDWTVVDGLPVTTVVRTIRDLAAAHIDGVHLAGVVGDAIVTRHVDQQRIVEALRPYAHYYSAPLGDGAAALARFLHEAGVPTTTRLLIELENSPGTDRLGSALQEIVGSMSKDDVERTQRALAAVLRQSGNEGT